MDANLDKDNREYNNLEKTEGDGLADAVTKPTSPYVDMSFGMGKNGYPAICMTQLSAKMYCMWLSARTGKFYVCQRRLSGNMPARPAPKPPTALETTPRNCPITHGMSATVDSNTRRSDKSLRILLVCTTCTAMFGNGC